MLVFYQYLYRFYMTTNKIAFSYKMAYVLLRIASYTLVLDKKAEPVARKRLPQCKSQNQQGSYTCQDGDNHKTMAFRNHLQTSNLPSFYMMIDTIGACMYNWIHQFYYVTRRTACSVLMSWFPTPLSRFSRARF